MLSTAAAYEVKILHGSLQALSGLGDEWRKLCEEGECNKPFYRPEWFEAYLEAFEPTAKIVVVSVRSNGRLRAVLPLIEEQSRFLGIPAKVLRSPTNVHSNRFDISVGMSVESEIWSALLATLAAELKWDVIELQDIPAQGHARAFLEVARTAGYPVGTWESMQTPYVRLEGNPKTVEEALGKEGSNFFSNLKKKMRKLEKTGKVALEAITRADQNTLDRFYEIEKLGWKGREGTAIACDAATQKFYDLVARAAARYGYLDLQVLRCGDDVAAMNYSLTLGGKHFIPKTTYSEKFSQSSPGQLIMREVMSVCISKGIDEFDFLGPWASWKGHWSRSTREHAHCYIFAKSLKGRFLRFLKCELAARARILKRKWSKSHEAPPAAQAD
jgi:CelD/BcsL family acetyltransferase involved in cellulose biosynthesis